MSELAEDLQKTNYEGQEISALMHRSVELRDQAAALSKKEKDIRAEKELVDQVIIDIMNATGVSRTGTDSVSASVTTKPMPSVKDWDAFYSFVNEKNASYLFQRRISQKAVEEFLEIQGDIPGVEIFQKTTLSLRKA